MNGEILKKIYDRKMFELGKKHYWQYSNSHPHYELRTRTSTVGCIMAGEKILVVDDDRGLRTLMKTRLEATGYQVALAGGGDEALSLALEEIYSAAILDLKMDGLDGISLMKRLLRLQPHLPVIILTAYGTIATAVDATKKGAYDFLTKPFEAKDLLDRLRKALEVGKLKAEVDRLRVLLGEKYHFDNIIATSRRMQEILQQVAQIAPTDSTICLYGESGTGKELIAKAIHMNSARAQAPFAAINCGAIPEGLLENELFGHVKGAFTGADQPKQGLLQHAEGGTLFMDEIADLPMSLQVKLLRLLQENEFYQVGGVKPIKANARYVVATNQGGVSADTAMRLARYFGGDARSWLNLQAAYDLRVAEIANGKRTAREISPAAA